MDQIILFMRSLPILTTVIFSAVCIGYIVLNRSKLERMREQFEQDKLNKP